MPGWNLSRMLRTRLALTALVAIPMGVALSGVAQQHIETSTFNQAPLRPKEDPAAVAHGKQVYDARCASCHAGDLRGSATDPDKGPNLLRSQPALADHGGDTLTPIMLGQYPGMASHKIDVSQKDASDIGAYIRSQLALIGSQGRPPGESQRSPNILVGDATHGEQVFAKTCASCHSATGDLKGFATHVPSAKLLQAAWLRGTYLGHPAPPVTATVTETGKVPYTGTLIHIDDFLLTLKMPDGSVQTIRRNGAQPKVAVKDPLEAHRKLLPTYTDKDIHDLTAYLVTLK